MENYSNEKNYDHYKKDYAITTLYLLGFSVEQIKQRHSGYDELIDKLINDKFARTTHKLSVIRMDILKNFKTIAERKSSGFIPIDQMSDLINTDYIRDLRVEENIEVVKPNRGLHITVAYLNDYIKTNVERLGHLYPNWIKFEYIKDLFLMPDCHIGTRKSHNKEDAYFKKIKENVSRRRKLIGEHKRLYSFQLYYNVPDHKFTDQGDIFLNDDKFLTIIYSYHNDVFKNRDAVIDANIESKTNIYDFIDEGDNIVVVVDCENVSPSRFVSVFLNLDQSRIRKIKKFVLYNDNNTSRAWQYIHHTTNTPVISVNCNRILENKSVVDQNLITNVCKMHYEEKMDSFILASSDSDFMPLITNLDKASFLVLVESDKCSHSTTNAYQEYNVKHCFMDDFLQSTGKRFEDKVLLFIFEEMLNEFNNTGTIYSLDVDEILDHIFADTFFSQSRDDNLRKRESFYNNYFKKGLLFSIKTINDRKRFVLEVKK